MKNLSILILTFLILSNSYSQVNGFFGKKNYIDFGVDFHSPLLYNFYSSLNNSSNNTELRNVNYGFHTTYSRVIQNNIALGVEGGLSYFSVSPDIFNLSSNYFHPNLDALGISKLSIMPKFEFAYNDALLPIGVSSQIGIGFNFYKAIDKNYTGTISYYNDFGNAVISNVSKDNYFDYSNQETTKGYTVMYKLTMRIPINKSLLYHFGFRYTFNFVPSSSNIFSDYSQSVAEFNSDYILTHSDIEYAIKAKENRSLIMFETGVTFAF